jgi:FkbM family methyltransferase
LNLSLVPEQPDLVDRLLAGYARRRWRGFISLRRLLRRPRIRLRTRYGAVFSLCPEDYIDRIVLRAGFYETEVYEALRPFFAPGAVLWDIGANFGLQAVSVARAEPAMQVHGFEPNPAVYSRLQAHARSNGTSVRCWPLALGDRDGTATLHINTNGNPGMTTLAPWSEARYDAQIQVTLVRAATLIARGDLPCPTLIKIDVEGSEAAVLDGFGDLLSRPSLQAVVFESRADLLADPASCPAANLLLAAGFHLHALDRTENSDHALGNFLASRTP